MDEYSAILIPGKQDAADRAIRECADQNGGVLVGNPTIQGNLTGIIVEGTPTTVVLIEDDADRGGWWREWAKVHGCKFADASTTRPR